MGINDSDLKEHIYYINHELLEDNSNVVQAIVYLNGKHYHYVYSQHNIHHIWVFEIDETEVERSIIELRGKIYSGFRIYDAELPF